MLYPSLRVFDTGMGRKETLFSKNSALSQLDKHLKEKLHNWNWQSILILLSVCLFFSPLIPRHVCYSPRLLHPAEPQALELRRRAPSSAHPQPGSLKPGRAAEIRLHPRSGPDLGSLLLSRALKYLTKCMFFSPFRFPLRPRSGGFGPGL